MGLGATDWDKSSTLCEPDLELRLEWLALFICVIKVVNLLVTGVVHFIINALHVV